MKKKSYSRGAGAVSLLGEMIGENLFNTGQKFSEREALIKAAFPWCTILFK